MKSPANITEVEKKMLQDILAGKSTEQVKKLLEIRDENKYPALKEYSFKINKTSWPFTESEILQIYFYIRKLKNPNSELFKRMTNSNIKSGNRIKGLSPATINIKSQVSKPYKNVKVENKKTDKKRKASKKGELTAESPLIDFRNKKIERLLGAFDLDILEINTELKRLKQVKVNKDSILTEDMFALLLDYLTPIKRRKAPNSIRIRKTKIKNPDEIRKAQVDLLNGIVKKDKESRKKGSYIKGSYYYSRNNDFSTEKALWPVKKR